MSDGGFGFEIPMRTVAEVNSHTHWRVRQQRAKQQRGTVHQYLWLLERQGYRVPVPVTVTLIRVAPRLLDTGDNLPSALKASRDGIADYYKQDDRQPSIVWRYDQQRGRPKYYAIRVVLEPQKENPI